MLYFSKLSNLVVVMDTLPKAIAQLIDSQSEGVWWDFKLKHHSTNSDLIHDVLCLANSVTHTDKYLIFGVNDDGKCVGISQENQLNQATIIDIFDSVKFLGRHPNLSLKYYEYAQVVIGVLTIKDEPFKPYVLAQAYKKKEGRTIPLGVVFNRVQCRNTPIDSTAKDYDIEKMWKERLNIPEKNRVVYWGGTCVGVTYTLPVSLLSFSSLTFTFIHLESNALISVSLDVEAFEDNPLLLAVGNDLVQFEYTEQYEDNVYSEFIYHQPNLPSWKRTVELRRISGTPK